MNILPTIPSQTIGKFPFTDFSRINFARTVKVAKCKTNGSVDITSSTPSTQAPVTPPPPILHLQPGDIIHLHYDGCSQPPMQQPLNNFLRRCFPSHSIITTSASARLTIIRPSGQTTRTISHRF